MDKIIVEKEHLISILKTNMSKHLEEYKETYKNFGIKVLDRLEEIKLSVLNNEEIDLFFNLTIPQTHENEYETIIAMLEMDISTEIYLSHNDFKNYIQDSWDWSQTFKSSSSFYNSNK